MLKLLVSLVGLLLRLLSSKVGVSRPYDSGRGFRERQDLRDGTTAPCREVQVLIEARLDSVAKQLDDLRHVAPRPPGKKWTEIPGFPEL